jgi:hypothetical protein
MSTIEPYMGTSADYDLAGSPEHRISRQVTKCVAQIDGGTQVQLARIDSTAELQAAKVDAMAAVSRKAMQAVALLTQMEAQLTQAVPHAADRLASIADLAAVALNEVVVDASRRVRW